jgi:glucosamine 6-phosphate synthetase-like amidotransferase/phosphosugar isomerase protein
MKDYALLALVSLLYPLVPPTEPHAHQSSDSGAQPLTNHDDTIIVAANGEIYNHRVIRKNLKNGYHFKTHSDCEVIIPMVRAWNNSMTWGWKRIVVLTILVYKVYGAWH